MAVGKAIDFSNPLIASRMNLEATLDRFSEIFTALPVSISRERLRGFSMPLFAASDGAAAPATAKEVDAAAKPTDKEK